MKTANEKIEAQQAYDIATYHASIHRAAGQWAHTAWAYERALSIDGFTQDAAAHKGLRAARMAQERMFATAIAEAQAARAEEDWRAVLLAAQRAIASGHTHTELADALIVEARKGLHLGPRTFDSTIPLWIGEIVTKGDISNPLKWEERTIGATPAEEALNISECGFLYIKPKEIFADRIDWEALIAEINDNAILGLTMPSSTTDMHISHLAKVQNLWALDLTYARITDAGLQYLSSLSMLKTLCLSSAKITGPGLEYLKGFGNLRSLDLEYSELINNGLFHIQVLENLQTLKLGSTKITDDDLQHLRGLKKLQNLNLSGTLVTDAGLQHLRARAKIISHFTMVRSSSSSWVWLYDV